MSTPESKLDALEAAGPTPHELGLSASPDLSWEDLGVAAPTPGDLFGCPQAWTWADFEKAYPKQEIAPSGAAELEQTQPETEAEAEP